MAANWMAGAVKRPGAFTAKAKAAGESVHQYAEEKKDAGGTTGKQANLALVFEGVARHKKKRAPK